MHLIRSTRTVDRLTHVDASVSNVGQDVNCTLDHYAAVAAPSIAEIAPGWMLAAWVSRVPAAYAPVSHLDFAIEVGPGRVGRGLGFIVPDGREGVDGDVIRYSC